MSDKTVWVCLTLEVDGGGLALIAATRPVALAWLQHSHAYEVEGAAAINELPRKHRTDEEWIVGAIEESEDGAAEFTSPLTTYRVEPRIPATSFEPRA